MKEDKDIWVQAAIAIVANSNESVEAACEMADQIVANYNKRFGELAMILKGIPRCAVCKKETNSNNVIMVDGVNFCDEKCASDFLKVEENQE